MRIDSPYLVSTTVISGSLEVTGTVKPGSSSVYDLGSSDKLWRNIYSTGFSGSLTKLTDGSSYLVAGDNIGIVTGSNGSVTVSNTATGATYVAGSDTQLQFNDGGTFGASNGLTFNKNSVRLGIGTSSPRTALDVTGGGSIFDGSSIATAAAYSGLSLQFGYQLATTSSVTLTPTTSLFGAYTVLSELDMTNGSTANAFYAVPKVVASMAGQTLNLNGVSSAVYRSYANDLATNANMRGSTVALYMQTPLGSNTTQTAYGFNATIANVKAGHTLVSGSGVEVAGIANAPVTTFTGLNVNPITGTGTITTFYGLRLQASTTPTITNRWGVSQEDSSALNYFAGKVGIGTSAFGDVFTVNGTTSVTGSFLPGNNTSNIGSSSKLWSNVYAVALTGSLTKLSDGSSYLLAGNNSTLSTSSVGAVTISSVPSGLDKQVQFNDGGTFSGSSLLTYDKTLGALTASYFTGIGAQLTSLTASQERLNGYLQLTSAGNVSIPTDVSAGYMYVSGSTNDIYFTQYNAVSSLNNTTRLRWLESNLSTGLLAGGILSTENGSTTFSILSGSGLIVSQNAGINGDPYPTLQYVTWPTYVSQSLTYVTSSQITYIGIDSSGGIIQRTTPFFDGEFYNFIVLGRVLHQSGSVTNGTTTQPAVSYGLSQWNEEFNRAFGPLKVSGHVLSASGSNLTLAKTTGYSYVYGRNYVNDPNNPNSILPANDPAPTVSKIFREYVSGSTPVIDSGISNAGYTSIDPTKYNNNGVLTSVSSGYATVQRVFWFPNSINKAFFVYYGSAQYDAKGFSSALDVAQNSIISENFVEGNNTVDSAIFLGYIVVAGNATDLTNPAQARIIPASISRGTTGGGGGTATGPTTPGGIDTYVQFNDGGSTFGGDSGLTYNKTTKNLTVTGDLAVNGGDVTTTSLTATLFNTNATTVSFAGSATTLNIGTAAGTNVISGAIKAPQGFSGSLTRLTDGSPYLVAGTNISLTTGSNGSVTVDSTASGANYVAGSSTQIQFNDSNNFAASSNFVFDKNNYILSIGKSTFDGTAKLQVAGAADISGSLLPGSDNAYTLGSSSKRWSTVYGTNFYGNFFPTSGTPGSVLFLNGSGQIAQSNSNFFWDSSNIRLGIGNAVPAASLHVSGSSTSSTPVSIIQAGVVAPTGKLLDIRNNNGSTVTSIDYLGNISANTGSFSGDLSVSGNLTVLGSSSIINSTIVNIGDNIVQLNTQSPTQSTGGLWIADITAGETGSLIWSSTDNRWKAGLVGSETFVVLTGSTDSLFNKTLTISGLDSNTISGGTQGGIGYFNTSGFLSSSAAGSSGQILQSAGTSSPTWTDFGTLVSGSNVITGSGTSGYLAKFLSGRAVGNSVIYDDGTNVGIGTNVVGDKLGVNGSVSVTGSFLPGNDSIHNIGSATKKWNTVYSTAFSGSLTKLTDGTSYIVAGGNMTVTTGSNGAITLATVNSGTIHGVTAGTGLTGGGTSGTVTLNLSNTGSAGTYGSASQVPVFATDAQGRVTSVTNTSIQIAQSQVNSLTTDLANRALTSTTITAGNGLTGGGDLSTSRTLSINDAIVATITGSTFTGAVKFNSGLSGSLTKLTDGSSYLTAGSNVTIVTGSNGGITVSAPNLAPSTSAFVTIGNDANLSNERALAVGAGITLTDGGANSSVTLGINDSIIATVSGTTFTGAVKFNSGLSGSLTKLADGSSYLVAGDNVTITSGSNGSVTIASFSPTGTVTGTGTLNSVARFTGTNTIGTGVLYDNATNVGIGTASTGSRFFVTGSSTSSSPTAVLKSGVSAPTGAVLDIQDNSGNSLMYVSGSGEVSFGQSISSIQTATTTTTSTSTATLMTISSTSFRSAEFTLQGVDSTGSKFTTAKIIAIHNGTTTTHTEYGAVSIGGIAGTFSVTDPSAGSFLLQVTPSSTNSTVWKVTAILTKV